VAITLAQRLKLVMMLKKTYLPKTLTSGNLKKGLFTKRDFIYKPEDDE